MHYIRFMLAGLFILFLPDLMAQHAASPEKGNWSKGTPDRFVGDVWVEYFVNDSTHDFLASRVLFEPSARSNWHFHKGKQIIFGIDGEGYYKAKGKPLQVIRKGDVVVIEAGTIHSHGSQGKRFMQGVMMNEIRNPNESTKWLEPVAVKELN